MAQEWLWRKGGKIQDWRFKSKVFVIGNQYNKWKGLSPIEDEYIYIYSNYILNIQNIFNYSNYKFGLADQEASTLL